MKQVTLSKRICAVLTALFLLFSFFFVNVVHTVRADTPLDYDSTSITDDLRDMNIDLYPKDPTGKHRVIRFSEYCYSDAPLLKDYYGLYFYVYNPSEREIQPHGNVANVAIAYNADGGVSEYANVNLKLVATMGGKTPNRFFKFKIEDTTKLRANAEAYAQTHNGQRRYDIAGLQLRWVDTSVPYEMDTDFGKTYYFTGYAKGCGATSNEESSLAVQSEGLETINLEVQHTYYRTKDYQDYVCDELNTAYFSIDNEVFAQYGDKLQKIKAEWYEYKTNPIFVTSDENAYDALKEKRAVDLSGYDNMSDEDFKWRVIWEENYVAPGMASGFYHFDKAYNPFANGKGVYNNYTWASATPVSRLDWIFKASDVKDIDDFSISSAKVQEYMEEYTRTFSNQGVVESTKGNYATGLFADRIDEDRIADLDGNKVTPNSVTRGKMTKEIDAGDSDTMLFQKPQSWWDKIWGKKPTFVAGDSFSPIVQMTASDVSGTAEDFAKNYYVNEQDAPTVMQYCKDELNAGRTPILFRFAKTDYYASQARFDKAGDGTGMSSIDGYVAQETMFLGFDIISLTFRTPRGEDTVIAVVSDPIDIINGIEAPSDMEIGDGIDWKKLAKLAAFAIGIVLLVALLGPFLPLVVQFIVCLITAPFKLIAWIVKGIRKIFNRRE